jgi:hypothetical protein
MKAFPSMVCMRWNTFRVCSAYFDWWFWNGLWFPLMPSYAEHAQKLVTRWLSMRGNWLLVGWACTKIGYLLAEQSRKSLRRTTCISKFFLSSSCHPFFSLLLPSLSNFLCPLSHVFVLCLPSYVPCLTSLSLSPILCPLSHVSVPCLPSNVPSFKFLFLESQPLCYVLRLCSLSLVFCTLSHVICSLSPILVSIICPTCSRRFWWLATS